MTLYKKKKKININTKKCYLKICKDNMKDENDQRTNIWYKSHTNDPVQKYSDLK